MQAVASAARFRSKDGERLLARYIDDVQSMIPFLERNDLAGLQQFEPTLGFMRYNGINGLVEKGLDYQLKAEWDKFLLAMFQACEWWRSIPPRSP